MASADNRTRRSESLSPPLALQVVLLKRTYVLPWSQFLYAEGGNDEVRLTFATHDVLVKGSNLEPLLAAIAEHGLLQIAESSRADRFLNPASANIREITVEKAEQD